MCENDVFVLPVNILTGVARQLLGPHDTLPCVLIHVLHFIPYAWVKNFLINFTLLGEKY